MKSLKGVRGVSHFRFALFVLFAFSFVLADASCGDDRSGDIPPRADVEGQPLGANIRRVIAAMALLGVPIADDVSLPLDDAVEARESERMQELLDPQVLFVIRINPEERVKVSRGPAHVTLQQHGFRPVLVKVLNGSTATKPLRIVSPQAGAVYAGVAKLSMQRQQSPELIANENTNRETGRFLAVEMFDGPPMTDRLSGLQVEYAIALILSTEAGSRDMTIGFDLGQGEQDLGFRGEASVLLPVRPALPVRLSILDDDGSPTTASLIVRDRQGHIYPLQAKRLAPDFFFQPQVYRADGETLLLPPGEFTVQSGRGPEYRVDEQSVKLANPSQTDPSRDHVGISESGHTIDVRLKRWVDPMRYGFYSGDHHIHAAGCAHYTSPTEGVVPNDMFRQVKGEGLNVGCVLTWGPCFVHQRQFFEPKPNDVSEPLTLLKYDLEISGFGSQALGHVCLLNLRDQTWPGSEGTETKGWPTWTTPVMRWTRAQGGITGYAHSASGLAINPASAAKRLLQLFDRDGDGVLSINESQPALLPEPFSNIDADGDRRIDERELSVSHDRVADQLPNLAIPEMNGVGAMEICVATAEGVCDFISSMDTQRIQEWNTWYHLLNCGFPLKVSGETDFPCMSSRRVGQGRVYVNLLEQPATVPRERTDCLKRIDFTDWCTGLASGRSYVSDGFAHALDFRVNDAPPGIRDVSLDSPGAVTITARVCFAPETPASVAQGTKIPATGRRMIGDTVELHAPRVEGRLQAISAERPTKTAEVPQSVPIVGMQSGGERLIEIVVNGQTVASQKIPADGSNHDLKFQVSIERSSWVALRQFPQLHTNTVNVIVNNTPVRASRASARWCEQTIVQLWKNRETSINPAEREAARETFDRAKARFRQIASECQDNE